MSRFVQRQSLTILALLTATSPVAAQNMPEKPIMDAATAENSVKNGGIFSTIFGCDASGSKQVIGAAGGSVVGGAIGNRVAGKGNRKIGTIVGAAVGAAAGSALGCKLQRADQRRSEEAAIRAAETNQSQNWKNSTTGASGSSEIVQEQGQLSGLVLAPKVEPTSGYSGGGGYYTATAKANFRTMPGLDGEILGQLARGEKVWAAGAAVETGWLLITQNNTGIGYVSPTLLQRAPDAMDGCKLVRHIVNLPDKSSEVKLLRACPNSEGNWALQPVTS